MLNKANIVFFAAIFYCGSALGQAAPGAAGSNEVIPEKDRALPEAAPKSGVPINPDHGESLSDKLDAGEGVIKPKPGVDPGIVKAAPVPDPRSMPVIPPPGTPGGPPGPQAK
jgi:hypothetical protein